MERGGGGGVGGEVLPRFVVARSRVSSRIGLDSQVLPFLFVFGFFDLVSLWSLVYVIELFCLKFATFYY